MDILKLLVIIIIIAVLIVLFIMLIKKKKMLAIGILTSVLVLCVISILLYNTSFYNNSDKVTIKNGNDMDYSINIDNHLLQYEYTFAQFSSDLDFNEVNDVIKSQCNNEFFDKKLNQIVFTDSDTIYTIKQYDHSKFLLSNRYKYCFSSNIVGIVWNSNNIDVPFPNEAIDESVEGYSNEMKIKCDYDDLKEYYKTFSNVEFTDNAIILSYDSYKISLVVENGMVNISIE